MKRHRSKPRPDWTLKVESIGLSYHSHEQGAYWDETAFYEFAHDEVRELESAATALHRLCLEAAAVVVERGWWSRVGIPAAAIPLVRRSWEQDEPCLYGRFDVRYDGSGPPKLLEYNADTPTALLEASVAQWFWLEDLHPGADQLNSVHDRLIDAWKRDAAGPVHFASVREHPEDIQTVLYLRDTCVQAGIETRQLHVDEIGWDSGRGAFVDLEGEPIVRCFKLYPWEWMWNEEFGCHLQKGTTSWIEPAWKMILSSKGLLAVLWELFPEHPNLLAAHDQPGPLGGFHVRKPFFSREGANITWVESGEVRIQTPGRHEGEPCVYQAIAPAPDFDGNRPVLGLWVVDHVAAGLGVREDHSPITGNLSRFVPHLFHPSTTSSPS